MGGGLFICFMYAYKLPENHFYSAMYKYQDGWLEYNFLYNLQCYRLSLIAINSCLVKHILHVKQLSVAIYFVKS